MTRLVSYIQMLSICLITLGCRPSTPAQTKGAGAESPAKAELVVLPDFGPSRLLQPGIKFQETTVQRGGVPMKVWYYEPENAAGKLPLVVVPPAGSNLIMGMALGDGDRPEHLPYVLAGYAVISFEIDGYVENLEQASDQVFMDGTRKFKNAQAGLVNAKTALDLVQAKLPQIDPERIYMAGHSSAATLVLLTSSLDSRVKACAAYAPVTDVETRVAPAAKQLARAIPDLPVFIRFSSPITHVAELKCPVFLFHAQDDRNVPIQMTQQYATTLKQTNPNVTLVVAPRGGHYDSMMRKGIPKAIAWLGER